MPTKELEHSYDEEIEEADYLSSRIPSESLVNLSLALDEWKDPEEGFRPAEGKGAFPGCRLGLSLFGT